MTLSHKQSFTKLIPLALVVAWAELLTSTGQVDAFASPTPFSIWKNARTRTNELSMAWGLPTPAYQKGIFSYWYTNCGTCVDRRVVYNDDYYFDLEDAEAEGLGLGFARLTSYERDLAVGPFPGKRRVFQKAEVEQMECSFPARALRGILNRIFRGNCHAH